MNHSAVADAFFHTHPRGQPSTRDLSCSASDLLNTHMKQRERRAQSRGEQDLCKLFDGRGFIPFSSDSLIRLDVIADGNLVARNDVEYHSSNLRLKITNQLETIVWYLRGQ